MKDTGDLKQKLLSVWQRVDEGVISGSEARIHIGLARAMLETLKVEIAAANLNRTTIPPVGLRGPTIKIVPNGKVKALPNGKKAA